MKTLTRVGNTLTDGVTTYLIAQRKRVTPTKTSHFLLRKDGSRKTYISSLYGSAPFYEFEYKGIRYKLSLSKESATITRKEMSHV